MSRPVSGQQPPRKGGRPGRANGDTRNGRQSSRTNRSDGTRRGGRPAPRPATARARRHPTSGSVFSRWSRSTLLTWGTVAVVAIVVLVLVIVNINTSSSNSSGPPPTPTSPTVAREVTHIPASVYDQVGVDSTLTQVTPPVAVSGQPLLEFTATNGKKLPGVYYFGAEWCPYCAAERWVLLAALSRFGTFSGLHNMQSSSTDVFPNTQTFTFFHVKFKSPYLVFKPDEYYSNKVASSGAGYVVEQPPTRAEQRLITTYDTSKYFPGNQSSSGGYAFPFIDIGNKFLSETNYSPSILAGLSRDEIAAHLNDPKNPVTQAIVASANYLTAAICSATGQQPSSVCTSKGVLAAAKVLGASK